VKNARLRRNGGKFAVNVTVKPLAALQNAEELFLVSFEEAAGAPPPRDEAEEAAGEDSPLRLAESELAAAREELAGSVEEMQSANEELQSSNEELETTNEELQSTNEELETMNEELQSTNEELQTVNEELRTRSEELNHLNSFFESVLGSLRAAAIVVNKNLDVLIWNERAHDLWGLRSDEVQGKSLLNLDIGLPVRELRDVIRPVLAGEAEHREVQLDAVNRRGKSIKCRVTCAPLLSGKEREGVILLMDEV